jgi:hypothetical protein
MNIHNSLTLAALLTASSLQSIAGNTTAPLPVRGDYIEVRSCDVYTGACFANAEMGLSGREAILLWAVKEGQWQGVDLSGLSVIAVVRTDDTLGDLSVRPRDGSAAIIVDNQATTEQAAALKEMACSIAGRLTKDVVDITSAPIQVTLGDCSKQTCASIEAGELVSVSTRCLGGDDHICGNEEIYYPPLTMVETAYPAFTELAAFRGDSLDVTWENAGYRSAYIGTFAQ